VEERSLDLPLLKVREVKLKKRVGKKNVNGKEYRYEYYTLPLLLYIPKQIAERIKDYIREKMKTHIYEVDVSKLRDEQLKSKAVEAGVNDYSIRLWRDLNNIAGVDISLDKVKAVLLFHHIYLPLPWIPIRQYIKH